MKASRYFKQVKGSLFFKDYVMPDPTDPLTADALARTQRSIYPGPYLDSAPETVYLDRDVALRLYRLASAYLHFVASPGSNAGVVAQLKEVRAAVKTLAATAVDPGQNK